MLPFAGHRWNPIFAIVEHRGRKSGRRYTTPIAARRVEGAFVISTAFGAQVDWHRNLIAAGGGTVHWKDRAYPVGAPRRIDAKDAINTFNAVQRLGLRLARIDGFIRVDDAQTGVG